MEYARSIPAIALLLMLPSLVSAQALEWAYSLGGGQFQQQIARATVMDDQFSVITVGTFTGSTDLDPGPNEYIVTSNGDADVFIQKLDAFGNFLWGRTIGNPSSELALGVAVDSENNIVFTGRVNGTVDLDPGPGVDLVTTPNTVFAVYVIKLDPQGDYLWGRVFGGFGSDVGNAIAVDGFDNIITVGSIGNVADLDPGPNVFNAGGNGGADIFVQKMDPDGNFIWGAAVGGSASDAAFSVAVDDNNDLFVTGEFRTSVDFDPGPGVAMRSSGGAEDIFVLKLDAGGAYQWAHGFGSTGSERARAIAVGPDGGPVLTGRITSVTDFDPSPNTFDLPGSNLEDAFICKLTATGDLAWAFLLATFLNEGMSIDVDQENHVYATGRFGTFQNNPLDLDPGPDEAFVFNNGGGDAWIASYRSDGSFRWGFAVGSAQNDTPNAISVGQTDRIAIAGEFRSTIDMDPGPGTQFLAATSGQDAFMAVYDKREPGGVFVRMNALLQGPYQEGFWPMRDDLRAAGYIPLDEPYTDMGFVLEEPVSTNPLVLSWTLSSGIVDWVLVELRHPVDPSIVLGRRAALVRVSSAVVAADGVSAIGFNLPEGAYHVALRHRNHLGVMTASPIQLSSTTTFIDLRDPDTPVFGTDARKDVDGTMLLWAGNALPDDLLKYTGQDNDRDAVLARIGGIVPTATLDGYWNEDVNMDGTVKYVGADNDRDIVLQNIGGIVPTATRAEQLP